MIAKLFGCLRAAFYLIRYGRNLRMGRRPCMASGARIKVKNGTAVIGDNLNMNQGAYFAVLEGGALQVGSNVRLNRNCMVICHDSIRIGDNCALGPNIMIYDHDHNFDHEGLRDGFRTAPVQIDSNCWIGGGVTILRGTHIGEGCVIGAGCVVKGEIPPHSLVKADRSLQILPITQTETARDRNG